MSHFVALLNNESADFGQDGPGRSPTPLLDTHLKAILVSNQALYNVSSFAFLHILSLHKPAGQFAMVSNIEQTLSITAEGCSVLLLSCPSYWHCWNWERDIVFNLNCNLAISENRIYLFAYILWSYSCGHPAFLLCFSSSVTLLQSIHSRLINRSSSLHSRVLLSAWNVLFSFFLWLQCISQDPHYLKAIRLLLPFMRSTMPNCIKGEYALVVTMMDLSWGSAIASQ